MNDTLFSYPALDAYVVRFDNSLKAYLHTYDVPARTIKDAIYYMLFPGGKRLRPLLVYLFGELLALPVGLCDSLAAAVELTHTYSLIHDDLPAMDNDTLRRGLPTCHCAFDEATAILTGDALQVLAIEILLEQLPTFLPAATMTTIIHQLLKASGARGMISGQSLDLHASSLTKMDESSLAEIHRLKTGALMMACADITCTAAKHFITDEIMRTSLVTLIQAYTKQVGRVFQVQDDYLDRFDKRDILGKGRSSDVANNKLTFAAFYSEAQLLHMIDEMFQSIYTLLQPLGACALSLEHLTRTLEKRITI